MFLRMFLRMRFSQQKHCQLEQKEEEMKEGCQESQTSKGRKQADKTTPLQTCATPQKKGKMTLGKWGEGSRDRARASSHRGLFLGLET